MIKKNKSMMVIGSTIVAVITILLVYVLLISTGVIVGREYTLRFEAISVEKEYDGTPLKLREYRIVQGEDLLEMNNHHPVVGFEGDRTDVGTSEGTLIVSIFDESNADVTSKYNIEVVGASMTVTPRTITVQTNGIVKPYSGKAVTVDDISNPYTWVSGEVVQGHEVTFKVSGSMTEIGSTFVNVSLEIKDEHLDPINPANYQIVYEGERGKIEVRPRYLFVTTPNKTTYYNGAKQELNTATLDAYQSELFEGHRVVDIYADFSEVNAGEYLVDDIRYHVVDENGKDVTSMYMIDPNSNFGTYVINKIPLTVDTVSFPVSKIYDGKAIEVNEENVFIRNAIQIPNNESYEIEFTTEDGKPLINVGQKQNIAILTIHNDKNEDTTGNYDITTNYGNLTVIARELTLKTFSDEKVFDGLPLVGNKVLGVNGLTYEIISGTLADKQELRVEMNAVITEGGKEIDNTIDKYYILDGNNNYSDVTSNYNVHIETGKLTINKAQISIITEGMSWNYDGLEHVHEMANCTGLPNDCRIEYVNFPKITDATYDPETGNLVPVDNIPNIIIYNKNNEVIYDDANGTINNFEIISAIYGKLTVRPLDVTIITENAEKVYDGELLYNHMFEIVGKRTTDVIKTSWPNDITDVQRDEFGNVTSVENKPEISIFDKDNRNVTKNYNIKYQCGSLIVKPITLAVSTFDKNKLYDGLPIIVDESLYNINCQFVGEDHIANITTVTDYVNVIVRNGNVVSVPNKISFNVENAYGQDVTHNYDIVNVQTGDLLIEPIELIFTTIGGTVTYDGLEHKFDYDWTLKPVDFGTELPAYLGYEVTDFKGYTDALKDGRSYLNSCKITFYHKEGLISSSDMENNIKVTEQYGEIFIKPITINVDVKKQIKSYDGKPFVYQNNPDDWYEITSIVNYQGAAVQMPDGQYIEFEATNAENYVNAGTYKNKMSVVVTDGEINYSGEHSYNYHIVYHNIDKGIEITKVSLTFVTPETITYPQYIYTKDYDGTPLTGGQYQLSTESLENFKSYWSFEVSDDFSIVDVQRDRNKNVISVEDKDKIVIRDNGIDITNNFEITTKCGFLQINPLEIEFQSLGSISLLDKTVKMEYSYGKVLYDNEIKLIKKPDFITEEDIEVDFYTSLTEPTDKKTINEITLRVFYNGQEITKNIDFTQVESYLQFTFEKINIYTTLTQTPDGVYEKTFDGKELIDNVIIETAEITRLKNNNMVISVINAPSITDVYRNSNDKVISIANKLTISIKDEQGNEVASTLIDNDQIDKKNSDGTVVVKCGELKINPIDVKITTGSIVDSDNCYYDGNKHYKDTLSFAAKLPAGWTYELNPLIEEKDYYINAGEYKNDIKYSLVIKDDSENEVSLSNFNINEVYGKIVIKPKNVYVKVDNAEKTFDNTPLTSDKYTFFTPNIEEFLEEMGHELNIEFTTELLYAGEKENKFEWSVTDIESGLDVSSNYKVEKFGPTGSLKVLPIKFNVISDSATKIYDGAELTCKQILNETELLDLIGKFGFTYEEVYSGSQTEVGYSENKFYLTVLDEEGKNLNGESSFSGSVIFNYIYGKLEVLPYVTGTGNLNADRPTPSSGITSLVIVPSSVGTIYLRDRSYGDYASTGWSYATPYVSENYDYNPNMILSKLLEENPSIRSLKSVDIKIDKNMPYLIPYYSKDLYQGNTDDTHISVDHSNEEFYTVDYYFYNYNLLNLEILDEDYKEFEKEYREYVYDYYLKIDKSLQNDLLERGKNADINVKDVDLIFKIATYIQSFEYGSVLNRAINSDIVKTFFDNEKGTCQDFSSAAVMMYRAYGIPARFVTGFAYNVSSEEVGQNVNITQDYAHAWVEVYVDGMGWINVEVTGGNDSNISDGGPSTDEREGLDQKDKEVDSKPTGSTLFRINSERAGNLYLRGKSFGNYNNSGFNDVETAYQNDDYNPLQYPSFALSSLLKSDVSIDLTSGKYNYYLLPYYTNNDYSEFDDTRVNGNIGEIYTTAMYYYDSLDYANYPQVSNELATYELDYRNYVYDTYVSLDGVSNELKLELAKIIANNNLDPNDSDIINDVKNFMQGFGKYDIDYSVSYESEDDVVLAFLTKYQEGVCRHYARTATLLYRALGIPARYTTGVLKQVNLGDVNRWINVTDKESHAWVEVYIDGFGWVPVEVTAGVFDPDYNVDGEKPELPTGSDVIKCYIYPTTQWLRLDDIDGDVVLNKITIGDDNLRKQGYYALGEIAGASTEIGRHTTSIISYEIYDKEGNVVTNQFSVELKKGEMRVYLEKINIIVGSAEKEYDGTPLTYNVISSYDSSHLLAGHSLNIENIQFINSGIEGVGNQANTISETNLIVDSEGNDVTNMYWVHITSGQLTVNRRTLVLTGGSYEFEEYDLEEGKDKIYYKEYSITSGSLLEGHRIASFEMTEDSYVGIDVYYAENVVDLSSVVILDENDNDVTKYYNISCEAGDIYYWG